MVSFSCETCGDILTKKKLDPHRNRCYGATFTCLDCMIHFPGTEYRTHTSCMTEAQKYQGSLYKEKNPNKNKKIKLEPTTPRPHPTMAAAAAISHKAYVEDAPEDIDVSRFLQPDDEDGHDIPPEAPSPPSAIQQQNKRFSVFDFYVGQSTPNPSHIGLPKEPSRESTPVPAPTESNEIVPYDYEANGVDRDDVFVMEDDDAFGERESELAPAPAPAPAPIQTFETPAPRLSRRSLDEDKTDAKKKDKKRKRLHIDTSPPRDEVMTDAPPVLHHSGLTGGLNRMAVFPPSPDYSGGDNEPSPTTPLKKKKHSKQHSKSQRPDGILGLFGSKPSKSKKRKTSTTAAKPKSKSTKSTASPKKSSHSHHRHSTKEASKEASKMIEPKSDDKEAEHQMILYKPRVDLFMGLVNKGPDSERGCSLNKALKRYHRERSASGNSLSKGDEEKELFRSLRLRRNDRGEIVLFSINPEDADDLLKDD